MYMAVQVSWGQGSKGSHTLQQDKQSEFGRTPVRCGFSKGTRRKNRAAAWCEPVMQATMKGVPLLPFASAFMSAGLARSRRRGSTLGFFSAAAVCKQFLPFLSSAKGGMRRSVSMSCSTAALLAEQVDTNAEAPFACAQTRHKSNGRNRDGEREGEVYLHL